MPDPPPLRVSITSDGTAGGSAVDIDRGREREFVDPKLITQVSASVRTNGDGSRVISTTVWVATGPNDVATRRSDSDSEGIYEAFRGGFEAVYDQAIDEARVRKSFEEWLAR